MIDERSQVNEVKHIGRPTVWKHGAVGKARSDMTLESAE